jgi:hypothetical protein
VNKKIRYAIGAVGAVPALAMIPGQFAAPAAHAGKTAATTTGKKVRTVYATDTAAFGPASSRSSTSPAISPDVGSCTGNTGHHTTSHGVTVRFYTRAAPPGRTCIGTIKVSDTAVLTSAVGGSVANANNNGFCLFAVHAKIATHTCRRVFLNTSGANTRQALTVVGFQDAFSTARTAQVFSVIHSGHFKNNGF